MWVLFTLIFLNGICGWEQEIKYVDKISDDNFSEFYKYKDTDEGIFLFFYSKEGSWSKIALTEFDTTAKILSKTKVKFGSVCIEDNVNFPEKIDLIQIPCLVYIHGDNVENYRGALAHIEIMNWVLIKIVKDLNINTLEALDAVLNVPKSREALALLIDKDDKFSILEFIYTPSVIQLASVCIFFHINSVELIERLESLIAPKLQKDDAAFLKSGRNYVVVLREFEYKGEAVLYKGSLDDYENVVNFIKYESIPIMVESTSRMLPRLVDSEYKIVYIYTNEDDLSKVVSVEKICKFFDGYRSDTVLVHLSSSNIADNSFINALGIDIESKIAVRAAWKDSESGKIRKYQPQDFDEEKMDYKLFFNFVKRLIDNKLQPYFKSQPSLSKSVDTGPVKTIVGSDFQERILDSKEDVFLMIYAPWCGHCHKIRPLWRQLGILLQNVKGIVVAKFDAINNELDELYISDFPTIRMYPYGQKSRPIDFNMDLTIENLLEFAKRVVKVAKFDSKKLASSITKEPLFEKYPEL